MNILPSNYFPVLPLHEGRLRKKVTNKYQWTNNLAKLIFSEKCIISSFKAMLMGQPFLNHIMWCNIPLEWRWLLVHANNGFFFFFFVFIGSNILIFSTNPDADVHSKKLNEFGESQIATNFRSRITIAPSNSIP